MNCKPKGRNVKVTWNYIGGSDTPTEYPNEPSPEGAGLGAEIARLAGDVPDACHDCAFRVGSVPNQCAATVSDALKSVLDGDLFYCHHGEGKLCEGWIKSRKQF